jgi:hypothetical protein
MAKVTIHRENGDFTVEDITFDQVKELVGVNGYGSHSAAPRKRRQDAPVVIVEGDNDVHTFLSQLSDRGRSFIAALREHPDGVEANALASLLKLNDARQIGGFTGGGLSKLAKKCRIRMNDIYKSKVTFPNGTRTRMFYPGKLIKSGSI